MGLRLSWNCNKTCDQNDCGRRLCLLDLKALLEKYGIFRVQDYGENHIKSLTFGWSKESIQKVVEVGIVEGQGREEEGVVWNDVVL